MPDEFIEYVHVPGVPTLKLTTKKMTEAEKTPVQGVATREDIQSKIESLRDRHSELTRLLGGPLPSSFVEELLRETWKVIEYLNERLPDATA